MRRSSRSASTSACSPTRSKCVRSTASATSRCQPRSGKSSTSRKADERWRAVGVAAPGGSAAGAGGPASKFRRTCNLHACGLGVACRELRAIGLTGDGLPLPRKERPTCGARNRQGKPCAVKVEPGKRRCRFRVVGGGWIRAHGHGTGSFSPVIPVT
jgi:hypothetical protein